MSAETARSRPPAALTDRMSGRSGEEEGEETDLSVAERAAKVVRADEEALRAKRLVDDPSPTPAVVGSREEVSRARQALKASAKHHAKSITGHELDLALARGEVSEPAAEAVRAQSRGRARTRTRKR